MPREGFFRYLVNWISAPPERTVTVPIVVTHRDGATADDYSGVPANVVFDRIFWIATPDEYYVAFRVKAILDSTEEDDERLS